MVKAVGRLFKHLSALSELSKEDDPDMRLIQGAVIMEVVYIFGDYSGSGFGLSWTEGISIGVGLEFGTRRDMERALITESFLI